VSYVDGDNDGLGRQLARWAERIAGVTAAAVGKFTSDAAFRTAIEAGRPEYIRVRRPCQCPCSEAHPDDVGVCDDDAVITRRLASESFGSVDVLLCAPCAVAQGVAELPG
jgi:hypothetical protein